MEVARNNLPNKEFLKFVRDIANKKKIIKKLKFQAMKQLLLLVLSQI